MIDKKKQGRRNKANGAIFERLVRADLEKGGWTICKFQNQVDLEKDCIVPSKHKFNFFTKVMSLGSGWPDFIAFKRTTEVYSSKKLYEVLGVECKIGKYLDQEEKKKAKWLLGHQVFPDILIASKEKEKNRIKIVYTDVREMI